MQTNYLNRNSLLVYFGSLFLILLAKGLWYFELEALSPDGFQELYHHTSAINIKKPSIIRDIVFGRFFQIVPRIICIFFNTTPQSLSLIGPFLWYSQLIIGGIILLKFISLEFKLHTSTLEQILFISIITLFPYFIGYTFYKYSTANFGISLSTLAAILGPILLYNKSKKKIIFGVLLIIYMFNYYTPLFLLSAGVFLIIFYFKVDRASNVNLSILGYPILFVASVIISFCFTLWIFPMLFEIITNHPIETKAVGASENKMLLQNILNIPPKFYSYFLFSKNLGSNAISFFSTILLLISIFKLLNKQKGDLTVILKALIYIGFLVLPFLIPVLALGQFSPNTRLYSFVGIIFSFAFLSGLDNKKIINNNYLNFVTIGLLVSYLIFSNTAVSNQIEILNKDIYLSNRIISRIESIDLFETKKIVIIGSTDRHNHNSTVSHRLIGNSIYNLGGWRRIGALLNYVSSYNFKFERKNSTIKEITKKHETVKSWPDNDSVFIDEEFLVIKL